MKQCDEKDEEIRDVRAELCKNEDQIHKMNSVIGIKYVLKSIYLG